MATKPLTERYPYYRAFQEKYNLLRKDNAITMEWDSMKDFHNDMYEQYRTLRDSCSKVTHEVNGVVANKHTLKFKAREANSKLVNGVVGLDYTNGVPVGIYHSLQLAKEFNQPHANVRRKLKALVDSGNFGSTSKATVISGDKRRTKSEVELLTKKQYDTLHMAMTISSSILKPTGLYIIQGAGLTKIGISSNIESRFKKLTTSSPVPLTLAHECTTDLARSVEKELHTKYKEFNSHGEWFNLTEEQVKEIVEYLDTIS